MASSCNFSTWVTEKADKKGETQTKKLKDMTTKLGRADNFFLRPFQIFPCCSHPKKICLCQDAAGTASAVESKMLLMPFSTQSFKLIIT